MRVSRTVFSLLVAILILLVTMGCNSTKEVEYKTISFSDTNGVTTVYYPITMEKDIVPDDGKAKLMLIKP
tara:strand:- start:834 stop:1043 length:210 start_codon:yes stop_codon:yes gene_type:complete